LRLIFLWNLELGSCHDGIEQKVYGLESDQFSKILKCFVCD
jgi:hypothetical protein